MQMSDPKKILEMLHDFLEDYNVTYPAVMNLVFFKDAQYHGVVQYSLLGFEIDVSTSRTVLEYGTPLDIARSV